MRIKGHSDWDCIPFSRKEYERRINSLQLGMRQDGLDALVICGSPKRSGYVRYIANFESYIGTTMVLVPRIGPTVLITDSIFRQEPMQSGAWTTWIEDFRFAPHSSLYLLDPSELIAEFEEALNFLNLQHGVLGFVGDERLYPALFNGLNSRIPKERWKDGSTVFHGVASLKSDEEIKLFVEFGKKFDIAIDEFIKALRPGVTESDLLGIIMASLCRQGIQNLFGTVPPFVVSGKRTRLKNVTPSQRRIEDGDPVNFDLEPEFNGYYLDMSRSFAVGKPSGAIRKMIEMSQATERVIFDHIRPGVAIHELRDKALEVVKEAGLENFYNFKFHGQGTMRPAYPFPSHLDFKLQKGMVFTIESILVNPDLTSATIENAFLVTEKGAKRLVEKGLGGERLGS